jgi:hypothetical protein
MEKEGWELKERIKKKKQFNEANCKLNDILKTKSHDCSFWRTYLGLRSDPVRRKKKEH